MEPDTKSAEVDRMTVVITSCGRPELLRRTLLTFLINNTHPVEKYIISEDSGIPGINDNVKRVVSHLPVTWIEPKKRRGQIKSVVEAYSHVRTPWIFHMEEDWEFYRRGFIEDSMMVLKKYPDIIQVWLRELDDTNGHPILPETIPVNESLAIRIVKPDNPVWHGFSFNPGVKRMADYLNYNKITAFVFDNPSKSEADIGQFYYHRGMKAAIFTRGYVRHIGSKVKITYA